MRLALEVDLMLGANLVGSVKPEFQAQALSLITELDIPQPLKAELNALAHQNKFASKTAVQVSETNFRDFEIPSRSRDLQQGNSEVRFNAAHALGEIGSENAIASLSQALTHHSVSVRTLAIGAEMAVPALIKIVERQNCMLRDRAIIALGEIGSDAAAPTLIRLLEDKGNGSRLYAAQALGEIGSKSAILTLVMTLITEYNPKASLVIATALQKIGVPELLPHLSKILLTRSLYKSNSRRSYDWYGISYVPEVMAAIQRRCGYYNYGLMQSA